MNAAAILLAALLAATPTPVGHRGRHYPADRTNENTLTALRWDANHGVECETDTWRLADDQGHPNMGRSVIFHDNYLGRVVSPESLAAAGLTTHTYIGDVTMAQFKILRTKGGERLPTLRQWITVAKRLKVHCMVEVKWGLDDPAKYIDMGGPISWYQQPQAPGCSLAVVERMSDLGADTIGVKESRACPLTPDEAAGFNYVALYSSDATTAEVAAFHEAGIRAGSMYAGRPKTWRHAAAIGMDFIIAPNPGGSKEMGKEMKVRTLMVELQELCRRGYGDSPVLLETETTIRAVSQVIADTSSISIVGKE